MRRRAPRPLARRLDEPPGVPSGCRGRCRPGWSSSSGAPRSPGPVRARHPRPQVPRRAAPRRTPGRALAERWRACRTRVATLVPRARPSGAPAGARLRPGGGPGACLRRAPGPARGARPGAAAADGRAARAGTRRSGRATWAAPSVVRDAARRPRRRDVGVLVDDVSPRAPPCRGLRRGAAASAAPWRSRRLDRGTGAMTDAAYHRRTHWRHRCARSSKAEPRRTGRRPGIRGTEDGTPGAAARRPERGDRGALARAAP